MNKEHLTQLGAPILEQSVGGVLREKLHGLQLMIKKLDQLDKQDSVYLLRYCFAIPKLMYMLRTALCYQQKEVLQEYDLEIREGLEGILNTKLKGRSWQQCVLPMRKGGMGIRSAADLSLPAFLSSANANVAGFENLLPDEMVCQIY